MRGPTLGDDSDGRLMPSKRALAGTFGVCPRRGQACLRTQSTFGRNGRRGWAKEVHIDERAKKREQGDTQPEGDPWTYG